MTSPGSPLDVSLSDLMVAPDIAASLDAFARNFVLSQHAVAMGCIGKRAADLTEEQRFAVAICAGVRLETAGLFDDRTMHYRTEPCSIVDDGRGGFVVAVMARREGGATA